MSIAQANKLRELEQRIEQLELQIKAMHEKPRTRRSKAEMQEARNTQAA